MSDSRALALANGASSGGLVVAPQSFGEVMTFADQMSKCSFVPRHLRGKPADCLAVCLQALRWSMDPFSVAQKTYFVSEGAAPGYEAQLINAVIHSRAALDGRLNVSWSGSGGDLSCTVTGKFRGDPTPKTKTCRVANITTKNSHLWKSDPEQQLAYYTTRAWARLYAPDVIMGIYTPDEIREVGGGTVDPETGEVIESAPPATHTSRLDALEATISDPSDAPPSSDDAPASGDAHSQMAGARPYSTYSRDAAGAKQYLADVKAAMLAQVDQASGSADAEEIRMIMTDHRASLEKLKNARDAMISGNAVALLDYADQIINPPVDLRGAG